MMTDQQKKAIYKWRNAHPRQYYELNKAYYEKNKDKTRNKNIDKCRRYRIVSAEFKRFLNILLD